MTDGAIADTTIDKGMGKARVVMDAGLFQAESALTGVSFNRKFVLPGGVAGYKITLKARLKGELFSHDLGDIAEVDAFARIQHVGVNPDLLRIDGTTEPNFDRTSNFGLVAINEPETAATPGFTAPPGEYFADARLDVSVMTPNGDGPVDCDSNFFDGTDFGLCVEVIIETPPLPGGAGTGCFPAGTMIHMADNTLQEIQFVQVGDRVKTADLQGAALGEQTHSATVTALLTHLASDGYLVLTTSDGDRLRATPQQPLQSGGEYKKAGSLEVGSPLLRFEDGVLRKTWVTSIVEVDEAVEVYDLQIDSRASFFADGYASGRKKKTRTQVLPDGGERIAVVSGDEIRVLPNPSAGSVFVEFVVADSSPTNVTIYDVAGKVVRRLVDRPLRAGRHRLEWDGRDELGQRVGSGVYFYGIRRGGSSPGRLGRFVLVR